MRLPGLFIVVEGGDGAGKGTVIRHLEATLRAAGHHAIATREPGGTPEGLALRALLLAQAGRVWRPHAELLLMTAARVQHVDRLIAPALREGKIVLCDRFVASTIAYQGAGRGLDPAIITDLHRSMVGDIRPDLALLLDVDPAIALARSRARLAATPAEDEGRFESLDLPFHQRVRRSYLDQSNAAGWAVLDAAKPLGTVLAEAENLVLGRLSAR